MYKDERSSERVWLLDNFLLSDLEFMGKVFTYWFWFFHYIWLWFYISYFFFLCHFVSVSWSLLFFFFFFLLFWVVWWCVVVQCECKGHCVGVLNGERSRASKDRNLMLEWAEKQMGMCREWKQQKKNIRRKENGTGWKGIERGRESTHDRLMKRADFWQRLKCDIES